MKKAQTDEAIPWFPSGKHLETDPKPESSFEDLNDAFGMPLSSWLKFLDSIFCSLKRANLKGGITTPLLIQTILMNVGGEAPHMLDLVSKKPLDGANDWFSVS